MHDRLRGVTIALLMALAPACGHAEGKRLAPEQAKAILEARGVLLVDVRTQAEHVERHIPGTAALIPLQELSGRLAELEPWKDRPILLYCRSGNRTQQAMRLLRERGFTDVADLSGGILAWAARGHPTATGPFRPPTAVQDPGTLRLSLEGRTDK